MCLHIKVERTTQNNKNIKGWKSCGYYKKYKFDIFCPDGKKSLCTFMFYWCKYHSECCRLVWSMPILEQE